MHLLFATASVTATDNNDERADDDHNEYDQGGNGAVQCPLNTLRVTACKSYQHLQYILPLLIGDEALSEI